jgi:glyoxylase-like metal-dependent hydrolase (beta-lactamase superfamily II)
MRAMRAALTLFALAACAAQAAPYPFSFGTVKVAEGIYAFVEPPGHAIVSGNSTLIVGDDAALVVDTGHHPALTRRMVAEVRRLTSKPVRYVVNTHWHNDHVAGNAIYAEAFPEARFIAQAFTAKALGDFIRPYMGEQCAAFLRSQTAPLREALASGHGSDGKPLAEARRRRLGEVLEEADAGTQECREFRFRGADLAFGDRLDVELGHRTVEVRWLGRANTAGDAIVYVPDAKVLATGDIVVHPFPFATQSYISEWARALRRIEAMDAVAIIPGHGPVMHDKSYVDEIAALMESIGAQVRAAYKPGMSLEEVRAKVDLEAFRKRIAGDDPTLNANFDAQVRDSAVARAYQEAIGRFEPEGLPRG